MPYTFSRKKVYAVRLLDLLFAWAPLRKPTEDFLRDEVPLSVLIYEPFNLGDVASISVMIKAFVSSRRKVLCYVMCDPKNAGLFSEDPRVAGVIELSTPWAKYSAKYSSLCEWARFLKDLARIKGRNSSFALGIDPRGDIRSQVVLRGIGCGQIAGYSSYMASNIRFKGNLLSINLGAMPERHRCLNNLALVEEVLGCSVPLELPALHQGSCSAENEGKTKTVCIHIGGGQEIKLWSNDNWAYVIHELLKDEHIRVEVLMGPAEDATKLQSDLSIRSKKVTFTHVPLQKISTVMRRADIFIGLDSGPMNIAALNDVPVVALFGPGDVSMWYPLSKHSRVAYFDNKNKCSPCTHKACKYPDHNCMKSLEKRHIVQLAKDVLNEKSRVRL